MGCIFHLSIYLATTSCFSHSLLESKVGRMDDREVKHFTIWEKVVLREKELCGKIACSNLIITN